VLYIKNVGTLPRYWVARLLRQVGKATAPGEALVDMLQLLPLGDVTESTDFKGVILEITVHFGVGIARAIVVGRAAGTDGPDRAIVTPGKNVRAIVAVERVWQSSHDAPFDNLVLGNVACCKHPGTMRAMVHVDL
jgi:hypothetical protein